MGKNGDHSVNGELQRRIDQLNLEVEAAKGTPEEARLDVELGQLLMQQHLAKSPDELENEYRELVRDYEAGKLIEFDRILNDVAGTK